MRADITERELREGYNDHNVINEEIEKNVSNGLKANLSLFSILLIISQTR